MALKESEFILNEDGSIYHLKLHPEQLAKTIITVGDPERVPAIVKYFDSIEYSVKRREFHTQTGIYKKKRISVVSTGIGTGNIDIVFNELDALVNIDFKTREVKEKLTSLDIIRIGTSGSIQKDVPIDSFLVSQAGIGFDSMMHFYDSREILDVSFAEALSKHLELSSQIGKPYVVPFDAELASKFITGYERGITLTNGGFYGPQGRVLRLPVQDPEQNNKLASFRYQGQKITNLEMETAGMYGLAKLLGHRTVSLNAIVANRATGEFSANPAKTVDLLIRDALDRIVS